MLRSEEPTFTVGLLSLAQDRVWPSHVSKLLEAGLSLLEGWVLSSHFERALRPREGK